MCRSYPPDFSLKTGPAWFELVEDDPASRPESRPSRLVNGWPTHADESFARTPSISVGATDTLASAIGSGGWCRCGPS